MTNTETKPPSIGFVSTYPPTACGLATFTAALRRAIALNRGSDEGLAVVSLVDERHPSPRPEAEFQHVNGDPVSLQQAVAALNRHSVVSVQHEYGIYGGQDGNEVLDLMSGLEVPSVVTLHTVLTDPSPARRKILELISDQAGATVVMSETAARRLVSRYEVDPEKVHTIPHGAMTGLASPKLARDERPTVLTWGLIGPGKGLEAAIEAFARLRDLEPSPRYLILGRTHPKVQAAEGDSYLDALKAKAHSLGLEDVVEFDARYLDTDSLATAIRQADIALLPYESTEQVTSGVLVEAVAAGKPVVATPFPHAVEMLGLGAGALVPHGDSVAMAQALRRLLTEPGVAAGMTQAAAAIGAKLRWPVVAEQYESLAAKLFDEKVSVAPLSWRRPPDDLARVG